MQPVEFQEGHRRDIDGLRAVAILPVVLYHAGSKWFPGGFVGVDIFFVISGYLITSIIASPVATHQFSLIGFYVRRARRILPGLFLVLGVTFALGMALLVPHEMRNLGKMIAATCVFISNVMFWREAGYFDSAAELKPLLMSWSLGIEEQFYVFWPIALMAMTKWDLSPRLWVVLLGISSFVLSCWLVTIDSNTAFYFLPTRAWELMVGAALALGVAPKWDGNASHGTARNVTSIAGLALIAISVIAFDKRSLFPGWNALVPCVGAALLIWSGERAVINRSLLSWRPLVFIGLISYSLYLWHWPLLSLARIVAGKEPTHVATATIVALAFVLSALSWRFVEQPFRHSRSLNTSATLGRYATLGVVVFGVGILAFLTYGFPSRLSSEASRAEAARSDVNPLRGSCTQDLTFKGGLTGIECFQQRSERPILALWGDSQADAIAPGIRLWSERNDLGFLQVTRYTCPPLLGAQLVFNQKVFLECAKFNEQVLSAVLANPAIKVVVLVGRWAWYTETSDFGYDRYTAQLFDDSNTEISSANSKRTFKEALTRLAKELSNSGKLVVVIGQVPEMGLDVPSCLAHRAMPLMQLLVALKPVCSVSTAAVYERLAFTNAAITEMPKSDRSVVVFLPMNSLCDAEECHSEMGNTVLYYDDNHLSGKGAMYLVDQFHFDISSFLGGSH